MNNYLHIFENCVLTKGFKRTLLFDLQSMKECFVPNSFCDFIIKNNHCSIDEIRSRFLIDDQEVLNEYIDFIINNRIGGFFSYSTIECFSKLSTKYQSPFCFENIIIDIDFNFDDVFFTLNRIKKLNIPHIQIRFFRQVNTDYIYKILQILNISNCLSVSFVLRFKSDLMFFFRKLSYCDRSKIDNVVLYDSKYVSIDNTQSITLIQTPISDIRCSGCGAISTDYFSRNINHFMLSINYNSCLYKKLAIDCNGDIRNCPYESHSFGNIFMPSFDPIFLVENIDFRKKWLIKKDEINVCKDCEYRHQCTDCRSFIFDKNNLLSHPVHCTYNPYIAKWAGEQGYYPVDQCGKYEANGNFNVDYHSLNF